MKINTISHPVTGQVAPSRKDSVALPPSPFPFEGTLRPGQEVTLHGNIRFINTTNQNIKLRIQFNLQKGYHVAIESETASTNKYVPMNTKHMIGLEDGELTLSQVEKKQSHRTFRMKAQKV